MLAAPNALEITGGLATVMEAFEVLPVPPLVELTVTLLFFTPALVPCTFTETVQDAPAARVAAERLTEEDPAAAVAVPPHVLFKVGVVATTKPAGKLSVKAVPARLEAVLLFVIVKLKLVLPFNGSVAAPKTFVIEGGLITVRVADEVDEAPVPAAAELIVTMLL
jgi:hypothetical protein